MLLNIQDTMIDVNEFIRVNMKSRYIELMFGAEVDLNIDNIKDDDVFFVDGSVLTIYSEHPQFKELEDWLNSEEEES